MRTIGSNSVDGATPPERVTPIARRPDSSSSIQSGIGQDGAGEMADPRGARGLAKELEEVAAAPALPLVGELDLILAGVRATLESSNHSIPEELARVARTVLDDEMARLTPVVERRSAFVAT